MRFPAIEQAPRQIVNLGEGLQPSGAGEKSPREGELPQDQALFVRWLFRQAGLDASAYRTETLQRRLQACLRGLHARTLTEARRLIENDAALLTQAMTVMLVGVTSFFRDPPVFEAVAQELPTMMSRRPGIYVWSAGCAEGAELYSMAMLLAERNCLSGSYLLGTDCRTDALQRARAAWFEAGVRKQLPPGFADRYLESEKHRVRVNSLLRAATRWRRTDLLQVQEPGIWDVILCRNAIMYLRADAAAQLWLRLEALLRPGGLLVVGKAERPVGAKRLKAIGRCLYRRHRG